MSLRMESHEIDISQTKLCKRICIYLKKLERDPDLIEIFKKGGICNGLASLALYAQYLESLATDSPQDFPQDDWNWLESTLKKICSWDKKISHLTANDKLDVDRLISLIEFVQHIPHYKKVAQGNLHEILEDTHGRKLKLEYTFAGLFTQNDFIKPITLYKSAAVTKTTCLIDELLKHDKRLILISCGDHSLGIFKFGNKISLYNSNFTNGRIFFGVDAKKSLISAIYKIYEYDEVTPSPIAFRIFTFDEHPQHYPRKEKLLRLLQTPLTVHSSESEIKYSALHIATRIGSYGCVKHYLEQNASIDIKDPAGKTPLYIAAAKGYHRISTLFVEHGAEVSLACTKRRTPILRAADRGHFKIVKLLLERSDNFTFKNLITALENFKTSDECLRLLTELNESALLQMLQNAQKVKKGLLHYQQSSNYKSVVYAELTRLIRIHHPLLTDSEPLSYRYFTLFPGEQPENATAELVEIVANPSIATMA